MSERLREARAEIAEAEAEVVDAAMELYHGVFGALSVGRERTALNADYLLAACGRLDAARTAVDNLEAREAWEKARRRG